VYRVGQGNNVFIFPGLGLAAIAANARKITDAMAKVASEALASQVTSEERAAGLLFPSVSRLRAVSFEIAVAVARQAIKDGVAGCTFADVERLVREARWSHDYPDYLPA
jgi:malic enzyme